MDKGNSSFGEVFGDIFPAVLSDASAVSPSAPPRADGVVSERSAAPLPADIEQMFLGMRKNFIAQGEHLRRLSEGALAYGTVLELFTKAKGEKEPFVAGDRVQVVSGQSKGKSGVVVALTRGVVLDVGEMSLLRFADTSALAHSPTRRAVILLDGKKFEVACPVDISVGAGDTVTVTRDTLQIVGRAAESLRATGNIVVLTKVLDAATSEVLLDGHPALVYNGKCVGLANGVRVVLDASRQVIVANLGAPDFESFGGPSKLVEWSAIGGNEEAIQALKDAIELPSTHGEYFRHYNKKPPEGILLLGPPGCGKTLLARAAATAHARVNKRTLEDGGFFYIKGPEFLSKWVGAAEADIRNLFDVARKFWKEHGYKPVICFDEAEALFSKRGSGKSSDVEKTVVPTLLTEMDGANECPAIVLLLTNRPDMLDDAVLRPGRVDRKVMIARPNRDVARTIFMIHLANVPLAGMSKDEAAANGVDALFSADYALYEVSLQKDGDGAKGDDAKRFCLGDLASGALIEGIVGEAALAALRRDIANGTKTGVMREDIISAVQSAFRQNELLDHSSDLEVFLADVTDRVRGLKKLKQSAA